MPARYRDETRMETRSRSIEMIGVEAVPCSCKEPPAEISQNPSQLRWPKHHRHQSTGRNKCNGLAMWTATGKLHPPMVQTGDPLQAVANRPIRFLYGFGRQWSKVSPQIIVIEYLWLRKMLSPLATHPGQIARTLPVSTMLGQLRYVTNM